MTNDLKKWLIWTGSAGAIISAIAYIVVTVVLVNGFETTMDQNKQLLFAIIGAFDGLLITFMLRNQGISLAQEEPAAKTANKAYYEALNKNKKDKKIHTIKWFMAWSTVKDIFTKACTIATTTYLVLYIFIDGSGDFGLIGLAISNVLMFACFGIIAMSKAYDYYINDHIAAICEITKRLNKENK